MIRSMTGFGTGEAKARNGAITVEIKTVNHKFLDSSLKLPNNIASFEDKINGILQKKIKRGKVYLNLSYEGTLAKGGKVNIDKKAASDYYTALVGLKKHLKLKDEISIKDIVALPGVVNYQVIEAASEEIWPKVKQAVEKAVNALILSREKEGKALYADLANRIKIIDKALRLIESRVTVNINEYRKKFAEKVKDLTNGREIDMGRLEVEVAIYAKNSDISEEITRLKNHLSNLKKTLEGGDELGKKLDFIAQEMHREINTIGSKASDFKTSKSVIDVKGEIEKIREQAKNLE